MKKTVSKHNRTTAIENKDETVAALRALRPHNPHFRKMIELAIEGLETGVSRMTPEQIYEYLGRR
jgi:hypothetical protein